MNPTQSFFARVATGALLALLAACGGGGGGEPSATAVSAQTSTVPPSQSAVTEPVASTAPAAAASAPDVAEAPIEVAAIAESSSMKTIAAANIADTQADLLIVRAYGTQADGVGPQIRVRVNGVTVGEVEVKATEPRDYPFVVSPIQPGAKVDIVYTNDAIISGVDRNLFVVQLLAGRTVVVPRADNSVIDRGAGAGAFDDVDVLPGQSGVFSNGALKVTWQAPNLTADVTIRASSTVNGTGGPVMTLRVDGLVVGAAEVRSAEPADYVFPVPPLAPGARMELIYDNAAAGRALNVHYLLTSSTVLLPTAQGVVFDPGTGHGASDGIGAVPGRTTLEANGALRAAWPAPNKVDRLVVRASGSPAGGIAPVMQVLHDGVVLGSVSVGQVPADYSFPLLAVKVGAPTVIVHTNPGTANGVTRTLNVAYAINRTSVLRPTDSGVTRNATSVSGTWPSSNLTDRLTVRARGSLAANVGPIMQVMVDGVIVASTEVRNAEFADFEVPVFPMQRGRKVDVVFTNDAIVDGADRNLFIDYLVSRDTFVRPNVAGAVIDRGTGPAAFDSTDVVPASGGVFWSGAWRTTWPEPNITSTVTLRASGTLAGGTGPIAQLRVNGVVVSSVEVRSPVLADHVLATPPLTAGSQVELIYANDAVVEGVDRNLVVTYLQAGSTYVVPSMSAVRYDLGSGNAAWDNVNVIAGKTVLDQPGALRMTWPSVNFTDRVTVRAWATLAGNVGAMMQLRVDGVIVGQVEVRSTSPADYSFATPKISTGSRIDVAFTNDLKVGTEDRTLYVQYVQAGGRTLVPTASNVVLDMGYGEAAWDGTELQAGGSMLWGNGALRFAVPEVATTPANQASLYAASRLLMQGGFGGNVAEVNRVAGMTRAAWLAEQMAMPHAPDFVRAVQARYDLGDAYRPKGASYSTATVPQRFWQAAAAAPDVLRKRVAFALHQMLMVSQADSNLFEHTRAYANYLDTLNAHAFGNFRTLLEEVALSPVMGLYLSHMRNRPEDLGTGRMPDENFAREVMQLFSIGLHELNIDGTPRTDAQGRPIETYTNEDVMAMAKVFTGWSWGFPDNALTAQNFRWSSPDYRTANDTGIDLQRMKAYPGMHSTAEKKLFTGKPHAVVIPANTSAPTSARMALDALFRHPNVGPFVSRHLIQRLVGSHPSPGYVSRVAAVFNNNGQGVRGDLGAVVRAVLTDTEAVNPPVGSIGKPREPVLRIAQWMRSFDARSSTGQWLMAWETDSQGQLAYSAPSVFGYFRPGFVPPNTAFSTNGVTVPEMQIVAEFSTAHWVNLAASMASDGLGWTGSARDVRVDIQPLADMAAAGNVDGVVERLNLLLYAGRMSAALKADLLQAMSTVSGITPTSNLNRARVALMLALASSEFFVQP